MTCKVPATCFAAMALLVLPPASLNHVEQPFRLDPGEYRWLPFTVNQVPAEVDCRFHVSSGVSTVHMELLPMSEFRLFSRGREHDTLAVSPQTSSAAFRRIVREPGQYAVVVANQKKAPVALVSLEFSVDFNPDSAVSAQTLEPKRRLAVILISFFLFFAIVTWSGLRLLRAVKTPG